MFGLITTLAPFGTNVLMPPNAARARRTSSSGDPLRATAISGRRNAVAVGAGEAVAPGAAVVAEGAARVGRTGTAVGTAVADGATPHAARSLARAAEPTAVALTFRKSRRVGLAIKTPPLKSSRFLVPRLA